MFSFLKPKTLSGKITLAISVFTSFAVVVVLGMIAYNLKSKSSNEAKNNALLESKAYANKIITELDLALISNKSMAQTIGSVKNSDKPSHISREDVHVILRDQLARFPTFLGTYTVWEPQAFDGKDSSFMHTEGHDASGRFMPYWYRHEGEILLSAITGVETEETAPWYYQTKHNMKTTVMDPFFYDGVYMISVLDPIIKDGKFYGLTGTDLSMEFLQKVVDGFEMYGGKSKLSIVSQTGHLIAMSKHKDMAGKPVANALGFVPENLLTSLEERNIIYKDTVRSYLPFALGDSGSHWIVCIETPMTALNAEANAFILLVVFICLLGIACISLGTHYLVKKLMAPISILSHSAKDFSLGKLNKLQIDTEAIELKELKSSFDHMIDSQSEIVEVCSAIAQGDFNRKVAIRSEIDTLSISVNQMIDNLKLSAEEDLKRNWISDGLAKFGDLLRSETNLKMLTDKIVSHLVTYVKANQAGIFIVEEKGEDEKELQLLSCYAYERQKFIEKKLDIGEGLVGQCYLEAETILLTDVPATYVNITSGLGKSRPRCVLIVPLKYNEEVLGVLEMASFKVLEPFEIAFIEKLAESIASTLSGVKVNEKTKILLEQAQQQSEELRAQEEEMRQNLEELQATQEEITRRGDEVARVKAEEQERAQVQIETQKKLVVKLQEKYQKEIEGYQVKIKLLESKLS